MKSGEPNIIPGPVNLSSRDKLALPFLLGLSVGQVQFYHSVGINRMMQQGQTIEI